MIALQCQLLSRFDHPTWALDLNRIGLVTAHHFHTIVNRDSTLSRWKKLHGL